MLHIFVLQQVLVQEWVSVCFWVSMPGDILAILDFSSVLVPIRVIFWKLSCKQKRANNSGYRAPYTHKRLKWVENAWKFKTPIFFWFLNFHTISFFCFSIRLRKCGYEIFVYLLLLKLLFRIIMLSLLFYNNYFFINYILL